MSPGRAFQIVLGTFLAQFGFGSTILIREHFFGQRASSDNFFAYNSDPVRHKWSDRLSSILCERLQFRAVENCRFLVGFYYTFKSTSIWKSAKVSVVLNIK